MNYFLTAFLKTPQIDADPEAEWTTRWNDSNPGTGSGFGTIAKLV